MIHLQKRFANIFASRQKRSKKTKEDVWNFRCPKCGDSQKNSRIARGYIHPDPSGKTLFYKCFNCGPSEEGTAIPFVAFLRQQDPALHQQYLADVFRHSSGRKRALEQEKKQKEESLSNKYRELPNNPTVDMLVRKGATLLSDLPDDHPGNVYLQERKIPPHKSRGFLYVPEFKGFIHSIQPDKFEEIYNDSPALVFPLKDTDGRKLLGFQIRNLDRESKMRYMTIKLDPHGEKIFGLDRIEGKEPEYVLEGVIDSLFLPNAVAVCGSSLMAHPFKDPVHIFDNEPRNKQIVNIIERAIVSGKKVVLLPSQYYGMDINDLILSGMDELELLRLIKENTCSGLSGLLKFNEWRKI